jgi:hypothetical protein
MRRQSMEWSLAIDGLCARSHAGKDRMSYSLREPEWPAVCECRYDESRDEMDREDCPFHCDPPNNAAGSRVLAATRKRAVRNAEPDAKESGMTATGWRPLETVLGRMSGSCRSRHR